MNVHFAHAVGSAVIGGLCLQFLLFIIFCIYS